jgi:hypothetical protein
MAFDPQTGSVVDPNFIPIDPINLASPKEAILSASGNSILVSDQIRDVVQEYDLDGNYLRIFAPSVGVSTTIMDNIRGIELRPNGNLLVTVAQGVNDDSVVEFDTDGDYLGTFVPPDSGGLAGPFDVYSRTLDYLVPGSDSDAVHRYDATGASLGIFASLSGTFFQQVGGAANGNVLVANFSGTQGGVLEYTADGTFVARYAPITDPRGVYELGNGNILTTNDAGVYEIDRNGTIVETELSGVNAHFINLAQTSTGGSPTPTTTGTPPTATSTQTHTFTRTPTNTRTATLTRTVTSTRTPTGTPTQSPTGAPTDTPTASPSITNSATQTWTPTGVSTPTHTPTGIVSATPTPTTTACPINFSDVQPSDWFYEFVRCVYCDGAISGYADGTFRPYNNTTRGQLTKIIVLAFDYPIYTPPTPTFTDVPETDPFYQYIETAAYNEIVAGYADGTFRPYNDVTRGQLCKIVVVAAEWPLINPPTPTFSDVPVENIFYTYIETAVCHGIISGYADGTFRWGNNATRAQIAKIVCLAVRDEVQCTPPTP